jgi:hypothetical protein
MKAQLPVSIITEDIVLELIRVKSVAIEFPDKLTESAAYSMDAEYISGLKYSEKLIKYELNIAVTGFENDDTENGVSGRFRIEFIFSYPHFVDVVDPVLGEGDKVAGYKVDPAFSAALLEIAYSTARGVVYKSCAGTQLEEFILPVVDVKTALRSAGSK